MPKMGKNGRPKQSELPRPLQNSSAKAQRTFAKAHDGAEDEYGDEERANRVAYAALKRTHERREDGWVAKDEPGPSDERAKDPDAKHRSGSAGTHGGVDAIGNSKQELYDGAKAFGVRGRSKMDKGELADAIAKAQ
jgi:cation transport regulator ChaB